MKFLLILITWIIELLAFKRWFSCWLFKSFLYYTPKILTARVVDAINNDKGMPHLLTHILHNKVLYFFWGSAQTVLGYWDIQFLSNFIGIIGAFGVMLGVWYFFTKDLHNKLAISLVALSIAVPFTEMVFQPSIAFFLKLLIFGVIFQTLSLYGLSRFLKEATVLKYCLIVGINCISIIAVFLFPLSQLAFCLKI
ncbi:MAG TPA: hypothetical protein VLF93_07160 [Candidatus Saccharimonadales bacterium]|nr:hypothetical protein [Candidatus Saccharimonadales bacterium]